MYHRLEEQEKKVKQASKKLANVKAKISLKDSPLKAVLDQFEIPSPTQKKEQSQRGGDNEIQDNIKETKTRYRTDKPIYSRYSKSEKKLIGKIYAAIENAIADERLREALISNIENQITK